MSSKQSYKLTLSNNVTEKEGINYLMDNHAGFFKIDLPSKKELLDLLGISHKFVQSFDLIYIPENVEKIIDSTFLHTYLEDITFVELKTTQKYLPENPKGFFFGATENEFNFAAIIGNKFRFCLVSLNEKAPSFAFLTVDELEKIIKYKRIQYQISL